MLRFRRVVLSERSCNLLTGLGETANVERPVAAGHLQKYLQSQRRKAAKIRQTLYLVHIVQHFMKSNYEPKSATARSVPRGTLTQIPSNPVRRRLSI